MNLRSAALVLLSWPFSSKAKTANEAQSSILGSLEIPTLGSRVYDIESLTQNYVIDCANGDGVIRIGGEILDVNAQPKTDYLGAVLPNQWTSDQFGNGFDFYFDTSSGLSIVEAGVDAANPTNPRITALNYPFPTSKRFLEIALGQTVDLAISSNGNVVSTTGYSQAAEELEAGMSFQGGGLLQTSNQKGFYGVITHAQDRFDVSPINYLGYFDQYAKLIDQQNISGFAETSGIVFENVNCGAPLLYNDPYSDKASLALACTSSYLRNGQAYSAAGIFVIDEDGQVKSAILKESLGADVFGNPEIIGKLTHKVENQNGAPDSKRTYAKSLAVGYRNNNNALQYIVDAGDLDVIRVFTRSEIEGSNPDWIDNNQIQCANGNQVIISKGSSSAVLKYPNLRDFNVSEIIPNYSLSYSASGEYSTNASFARSMVAFQRGKESQLTIAASDNSVVVVRGCDLSANSSMILPVDDFTKVAIYNSKQLPYSLEDMLDKNFTPNSLTLGNPKTANQQSFFVMALPQNQLVAVVTANVTEALKLIGNYVALVPATERPTSQPTDTPSLQPVASPTFAPVTANPSPKPTTAPSSSHPSPIPSQVPTSNKPSLRPTFAPSSKQPSLEPSAIPSQVSSNPSAIPSQVPTSNKPSLGPTFVPSSKQPSLEPSAIPSQVPTSQTNATLTDQPNVRGSDAGKVSPLVPVVSVTAFLATLGIVITLIKRTMAQGNRIHCDAVYKTNPLAVEQESAKIIYAPIKSEEVVKKLLQEQVIEHKSEKKDQPSVNPAKSKMKVVKLSEFSELSDGIVLGGGQVFADSRVTGNSDFMNGYNVSNSKGFGRFR